MAGQKFEYDESGSTFYYFLLCFLGLILLPASYFYLFKRGDSDNEEESDGERVCECGGCVAKRKILQSEAPWRMARRRVIQVAIVIGWLLVVLLIVKVQQFDYEYANFDPYDILGVSPGANKVDVKRAYKKLSLTEHPDKGGDEVKFVKITKAYQALTDESARRNWELYGNPDGPGVMNFGIALPSWIVHKDNSVWVLAVYTLVFMVALPTAVGSWWYNSIKFSGDQVLLETTQLFFYFFHKTPHMMLRRALMVLSGALEFERGHNGEIANRPSDDFEVPVVIRRLGNVGENTKEKPLCFEYSLKARLLLHAHLSRLPLPASTLQLDRMVVVKKCPHLVQEMVSCVSQLVMLAHAGRISRLPSLDTMENTMRLSSMIVQALWDTKSQLLQLPHLDEPALRCMIDKKKRLNVKTLSQLASLSDADRRHLLRHLTDTQMNDVLAVLGRMPLVDMTITSEVLDDENSGEFTAGAITTVTVQMRRRAMSELMDEAAVDDNQATHAAHNDTVTTSNLALNGHLPHTHTPPPQPQQQDKTPVWMKNKKKHKLAKKPVKKAKIKTVKTSTEESPKPSAAGDEVSACERSDAEPAGSSGGESDDTPARSGSPPVDNNDNDDDDEREWRRCQARIDRRARALDGTSRRSHPAHAPHFPAVKHEYWWVYVSDRRGRGMVTAPLQVTDLVSSKQVELKFTAPRRPGIYTFTVCLRCDSYLGFDQTKDFKLDVKEAHAIPVEHPQWDLSDDDEEDSSADDSEIDDFATDEDVDDDGASDDQQDEH